MQRTERGTSESVSQGLGSSSAEVRMLVLGDQPSEDHPLVVVGPAALVGGSGGWVFSGELSSDSLGQIHTMIAANGLQSRPAAEDAPPQAEMTAEERAKAADEAFAKMAAQFPNATVIGHPQPTAAEQ